MKQQIIFLLLFISACSNLEQFDIKKMDLTPPMLEEITMVGGDRLKISANEHIYLDPECTNISDNINILSSTDTGQSIELIFDCVPETGREYSGNFRIKDNSGNSLTFLARFYGYNPQLPQILINEFTVKGSKSNPNKIELYVVQGGNMGGLSLYNGTKHSYDYIFTFPDFLVESGEYMVIRTCSDNYPTPYIEMENLYVDHDKKFIEGVRDIRVDNFKLSSTNGTITMYSNPYGSLLDCVIYSKNRNDDEKRYRNFGLRKVMDRVDELITNKDWIVEGDLAEPEDVIYIEDSTSTRSINRYRFEDNDTKDNWYTVDTREYSFGFPNSEVFY